MADTSDVDKVKELLQGKDISQLTLGELQRIIKKDWGSKVNFAAKPYLEAMAGIEGGMYGQDPWQQIIGYFLSNATSWKGSVAKAVKDELKKRLKQNKTASLKLVAEKIRKASKSYKVIIIDAEKKQVYESTSKGLPDLQKVVGGYIELAHEIQIKGDLSDSIYVNDEGLFGAKHFFEFKGAHQPFAGNGVVVGTDLDSGETTDVQSSLNDIKSKVKFLSLNEIREKYM